MPADLEFGSDLAQRGGKLLLKHPVYRHDAPQSSVLSGRLQARATGGDVYLSLQLRTVCSEASTGTHLRLTALQESDCATSAFHRLRSSCETELEESLSGDPTGTGYTCSGCKDCL